MGQSLASLVIAVTSPCLLDTTSEAVANQEFCIAEMIPNVEEISHAGNGKRPNAMSD